MLSLSDNPEMSTSMNSGKSFGRHETSVSLRICDTIPPWDLTPGEAAAAGSAAPAPSAAKGRRVSGTIDLDPSLKGVATGRILFVFAREAGGSGGPPVAVKRLPPVFPASFELSESDSMMGQPFPETLLIEARLDEDGDPTTRPPTDPKARLDGVKVGRTNLKLVLKRGQ